MLKSMISTDSIDFESLNNPFNSEFIDLINEMKCDKCHKVAFPPYKYRTGTLCLPCIEATKDIDKSSIIGPSKVELMIIDKIKIGCKLCGEMINSYDISDHKKRCSNTEPIPIKKLDYIIPKDNFLFIPYNWEPEVCEICSQLITNKETHDCITTLQSIIKKLSNKIVYLEKKVLEVETIESKESVRTLTFPTDKFLNNPMKLKFNRIVADYEGRNLPNMFVIFERIDKSIVLVYPSRNNDIHLINISTNENLSSLNGHKSTIFCIRYYKDDNKDEYIISSSNDNTIKVWDINQLSCILTLDKVYSSENIWSCMIMSFNNSSFILSSVWNFELMKIFDFKGNLVKQIGDIKDKTIFIDYWSNEKDTENYIINGNNKDVKFYDFNSGNLIKTFKENNIETNHCCAFIKVRNSKPYLFESDNKGFLRVWDINLISLLMNIHVGDCISCIVDWSDRYIIASEHRFIMIIDLQLGKIVGSLSIGEFDNSSIGTIIKFKDPELGECLLSGDNINRISLWS